MYALIHDETTDRFFAFGKPLACLVGRQPIVIYRLVRPARMYNSDMSNIPFTFL